MLLSFTAPLRKSLLAVALAAGMVSVQAGPMLFVSDSTTDTSIATVLSGAGYSVTSLTNQFTGSATTALTGALGSYDAVFWSATGSGFGNLNNHAGMLANLASYVSAGGRLFVTGYDSIASPDDSALQALLGGSGSVDTCTTPGVIGGGANSLTTGVVNLLGQSPGTHGSQTCDRDSMLNLGPDTLGIVASDGGYQWTLRSLGLGEIAYVSNGNFSGGGESAMWSNGSAYNGAVLNFALNASSQAVPEPGTLGIAALALAALGFMRRKRA